MDAFGKMVTPKIQLKMKSPEQGAATTVWAAIGKEWEETGTLNPKSRSDENPALQTLSFLDFARPS